MDINQENKEDNNNKNDIINKFNFEKEILSIKLKWLIIFVLFINILEFLFFTNTEYYSILLDLILILICAYDIYLLQYKTEHFYNKYILLLLTRAKYLVLTITFAIDFGITQVFYNEFYLSYDEYEKFFAFVYGISGIIRIIMLFYIFYFMKEFLKNK